MSFTHGAYKFALVRFCLSWQHKYFCVNRTIVDLITQEGHVYQLSEDSLTSPDDFIFPLTATAVNRKIVRQSFINPMASHTLWRLAHCTQQKHALHDSTATLHNRRFAAWAKLAIYKPQWRTDVSMYASPRYGNTVMQATGNAWNSSWANSDKQTISLEDKVKSSQVVQYGGSHNLHIGW